MVTYGINKMLADANAVIEVISVEDAHGLIDVPNIVFVDVRETVERQQGGTIRGAIHAARGFLEFFADPESPMHNEAFSSGNKLVVFCGSGARSALASKTLKDMGFDNVVHIAGGFTAWLQVGGPTEP